MRPSYLLGYWRPWNNDSNFLDSYCDYLRDTSLHEYSSGLIGGHIRNASNEIQSSITSAAHDISASISSDFKEQNKVIQASAEMLGIKLDGIKNVLDTQLRQINRNLDIVIEQQRLQNVLLEDIRELLKIPDSEKERQMNITLGIKYFVNAKLDPDLFAESLKYFLLAEQARPEDYFVLHRIGCIYLYSASNVNLEKAVDYFSRAAKLAFIESNPSAVRLANILTNDINSEYTKLTKNESAIKLLSADSYNKCAYAYYILGKDDLAVASQRKAVALSESGNDYFFLSKYLTRGGDSQSSLNNLEISIEKEPSTALAAALDSDLNCRPEVQSLLRAKNEEADSRLISISKDSSSQVLKNSLLWSVTNLNYAEKINTLRIY